MEGSESTTKNIDQKSLVRLRSYKILDTGHNFGWSINMKQTDLYIDRKKEVYVAHMSIPVRRYCDSSKYLEYLKKYSKLGIKIQIMDWAPQPVWTRW